MSSGINPGRDFARQAEQSESGLVSEMWALVRDNKKWWLTPILLAIVVLGCLVFLGGTGAAPFIYALF
jgi:hypothetical protein